MDETDSFIIKRMTEDARVSFRKIAKELGVSPDTVISRYRRLQEKGVIRGSTVVLDPKKIGYKGMAAFMIDTSPTDLLAIAVIKDVEHLIAIGTDIAEIPGVKDLRVSFWVEKTELYPQYFII